MRIDFRYLLCVFALPLGCDSGASVFQPDVARISHEAVSWALNTVADQGGAHLNAGYGELFAPPSSHGSPVSHAVPTQPARPLQAWDSEAFMHYTLTVIKATGETPLGEMISVHTSNGNFTAGKEYWAVKQAGLDDLDVAVGIEIEGVDGDWGDPPSWPPSGSLPVFTNDVYVSWSSGAPGGSDTVYKYSGSNHIAWKWDLSYLSGVGWRGGLTWYRTASSAPSSTDLVLGEGTFVLYTQTGGGSAPSGQNWYKTVCLPQ